MARLAAVLCAAGLALCGCGKAPQGVRAAALSASPPPSVALAPNPSPQADTADFVGKISAANAFELAAAGLAAQRAAKRDVKDFAAQMLRDHGKAADDLKRALSKAGQALTPASGPSPEQQQALDRLRSADPTSFDAAYMDGQVQAHLQALALVQAYAQNGDNVALRSFASQAAPVIQGHYEMASQIAAELK